MPAPYGVTYDKVALEYDKMYIQGAWAYTQGDNTTVGVSDTGIDNITPGSELSSALFRGGYSATRDTVRAYGQQNDQCGHGSKVAALATAPRNGLATAGIAYQADLLSYTHGNDVLVYQAGATLSLTWLGNLGGVSCNQLIFG